MKNKLALSLGVLLFFSLLPCYAQSSNNEQRIVGTWAGVDRYTDSLGTLVFNYNGTVTGYITGRYFFSNSKLLIRTNDSIQEISYYFSSDGRILVLSGNNIGASPHWLEKQ
jgi:hypothetical protein